jgi:acyl-lipid omega-6 desaturase (Delta-12 desaturase)
MSVEDTGAAPGQPGAAPQRTPRRRPEKPAWVTGLKRYEQADRAKVTMQLIDTLVPYVALLTLMYLSIYWGFPYWATLLLALPAAALMVRAFIFFHDCCHGSYVGSRIGLQILGNILGVMTFTPYADWRWSHGIHHSTSGNLDRRGVGDIWTMTVEEYAASSWMIRALYRLFRNPIFMFLIVPSFSFLVMHRIPSRHSGRNQVLSVLFTDAVLAAILLAAHFTIGIKAYLMVQVPVIVIGGAAGVWLFYVQHQFDPTYWARSEEWGSQEAAMQGSSWYKLPKVLQWISGNIGFHHIHHLRPRIPNYNLQRALNETPELQLRDPLSLGRSIRSIRLNVWDEKRKVLLSFRDMMRMLRQRPGMA